MRSCIGTGSATKAGDFLSVMGTGSSLWQYPWSLEAPDMSAGGIEIATLDIFDPWML